MKAGLFLLYLCRDIGVYDTYLRRHLMHIVCMGIRVL